MRRPSRSALPAAGMRSMSASPMLLTWAPCERGSSALTAAQKSAASVAACSSPCASVSAVKPAMSANRNVASALTPSTLPLRRPEPAEAQGVADDRHAREDHREAGEGRVEQADRRDRDRRDVVAERPAEVLPDRAQR